MAGHDENIIDISHMTPSEYKDHMRRLEQLTSCPCTHCTAVCDRMDIIADCEPYQSWMDRMIPYRWKR